MLHAIDEVVAPHASVLPRASDVADVLLAALARDGATAIWLQPIADDHRQKEAHRVSLERGRTTAVSAVLADGLGDAVLARLALLAELDLMGQGIQTGRCKVRCGTHLLDLLVTIRGTDRGLAGELRLLDDSGAEASVVVAALPDGRAFPEILAPGTTVGPYEVRRVVGRGGMGVVYEVEHTLLRKIFAMKILAGKVLEEDPDSARRFVREARAAARVRHRGIVDVSDFGSLSDGRHYLVMELLDARSLDAVILGGDEIGTTRAVAIVAAVARALDAAHAAGVVHRDLTPSNIFVGVDGDPDAIKLVDFGTAKVADADQADVPDGPPGFVLGTPYYMAPEQVQGLVTDARSDLYSLGVVLYELLTGRVPFDGESVRDIVMKHILEPAPSPRSAGEPLPDELVGIVARLLAKAPSERYQSAAALASDLDRVLALLSRRGWRRWLSA